MTKPSYFDPWTALVLKLAGIVLILGSLIDYIILLSTANFGDSQWVVSFTTQMVDRGFIPLVGLALLFLGQFLDSRGEAADSLSQTSQGLRIAALLIATVLGVSFLMIAPWGWSATGQAADAQVKQAEGRLAEIKEQLSQQVQPQLEAQISALQEATKTGQFQGRSLSDAELAQAKQQLTELQKLKTDPKALEAKLAPQLERELKPRREELEQAKTQAQWNARRAAARTALNSVLLAIGYTLVGWTGLRQVR
ncbi:HpsJ family protein [Pantanalinema rosaneae CENA516]|uniref:HpsJ family protein n=1 Tax=Pantanalinema rosaneae TaxID=1620701 RepID=UPI003D6E2486